jgi:hypothetical protein
MVNRTTRKLIDDKANTKILKQSSTIHIEMNNHDGPMCNAIFLVILSLFSFDLLLQSGGVRGWAVIVW